MPERASRALLLRWMGWFALANALLLALAGLRYFIGFTPGGTPLSWLYLVLVYPAHHIMLTVLTLFLTLGPLLLLWPARRRVTQLAVVVSASLVALIVLDSLLWSQSRFHLNALTLQILGWRSWVFAGVMFLTGLFFEFMLAGWVWRWVEAKRNRHGLAIVLCSLLAVLGSQLIHAWADASYYVPVTSVGTQLPVYKGFTAKKQLTRLGLVDPQKSRELALAQRLSRQLEARSGRVLNYPLHPLQCRQAQPMNLLLIMADAMRSDMLQDATAPFLWRYAQRQQWFTQHYSGGNSSRMGVFSLFYGLPAGYWSSFDALQRSSVLIDELQRQNYQLGLFTSSSMYRPVALDRTAFANVPNLRIGTEPASAPAWQRDRIITGAWLDWLRQRDTERPFFGLLFYDATNTQEYPPEMERPGGTEANGRSESGQRLANYRNAVRFVDGQIARVLQGLAQSGLAEHTVVIVTADHGEEFDDSGQGLRDHGSGYTRYQLQVPMIVHWPGKAARRFTHRTSHFDLLPTLLPDLLGCSNPPADYAVGKNLFDGKDWPWLLAGSYYNYAVLEPDQITITYPNGSFEVRDREYRISRQPQIHGAVLQQVAEQNSRFYRR
jgi:membrane-anchored protein YejM (alkaline phosphatase superfamily)